MLFAVLFYFIYFIFCRYTKQKIFNLNTINLIDDICSSNWLSSFGLFYWVIYYFFGWFKCFKWRHFETVGYSVKSIKYVSFIESLRKILTLHLKLLGTSKETTEYSFWSIINHSAIKDLLSLHSAAISYNFNDLAWRRFGLVIPIFSVLSRFTFLAVCYCYLWKHGTSCLKGYSVQTLVGTQ